VGGWVSGGQIELTVRWVAGGERRAPLEELIEAPAAGLAPVRGSMSYRGQRHMPGLWFSATEGAHVPYESLLERDWVMLLDFDPGVVTRGHTRI
jgi:hypothetical protein